MRLPVEARYGILALGLTATLAGCGLGRGGGGEIASASAIPGAAALADNGPAADYPMVLGEPYTVDGELYTPADTLNYDAIGYAGIDGGAGVTVAHKTLPMPSYVEVTSLATGKTILARVERRGPMTGPQLVALSAGAAQQLGGGEGTPVRVRRVNPEEAARAELRAGRAAPEPMETPKALVEVLRRKLPASGMATLRPAMPLPAVAASAPVAASPNPISPRRELPPVAAAPVATASGPPQVVKAYPLPPLARGRAAPRPSIVARANPAVAPVVSTPSRPQPVAAPAPVARPVAVTTARSEDGFVVQAGTFSVRANAQRVADAIGGYLAPSGKMYRVRTGPFTNRGQAEAALAKVRAAGYNDARVYTAG